MQCNILQVSATDVDSDNNGKIEYIIQSGDIHQQFSVDPITGLITVARPLDREMVRQYVFYNYTSIPLYFLHHLFLSAISGLQ